MAAPAAVVAHGLCGGPLAARADGADVHRGRPVHVLDRLHGRRRPPVVDDLRLELLPLAVLAAVQQE
eukprot:3999463-Lingulodinium_polyedra.AAC.1